MSVVAPPQPPRPDELELLIREARARQRRRRMLGLAGVAAAAAVGLAVHAAFAGGRSGSVEGRGTRAVPLGKLPTCRSDQLRLSAPRMWGAAAGSLFESGTLVNTSSASCAVGGWPAVRRVGRGGATIPVRLERWVYKERGTAPFHVVPLRPGAAATFEINGQDWNHAKDRACPNARALRVRPPGSGGWLSVPLKIPACAVWIVGPLVPGRRAGPPNFALSTFYMPPTSKHPFYSGRENGTSWRLRVRDSGDGRYCFKAVTDATVRGRKCGRLYGRGVAGKLGWVEASRSPSFVAGAVVSAATHMAISLSNGSTLFVGTMAPTRLLAPGISFFFTTIPRGTHPVSMRGRTDLGRLVVDWRR